MDEAKLIKTLGSMTHLIALHQKMDVTMKELVLSIAREHLEQSGVGQTHDDWAYTKAALEWMMGGDGFRPKIGGYYLKKSWPTHIRVRDLKPMKVQVVGQVLRAYPFPSHPTLAYEILTTEDLEEGFLPLGVIE